MRKGRTFAGLDSGGHLEREEEAALLIQVGVQFPNYQAVEEAGVGGGRTGARGGIGVKLGEQARVGRGSGRKAIGECGSLIEERQRVDDGASRSRASARGTHEGRGRGRCEKVLEQTTDKNTLEPHGGEPTVLKVPPEVVDQ